MVSHLLSFFPRDTPLAFKVTFVAHEDAGDVTSNVFFNLVHPVLNRSEGFPLSDIISDYDSVGALIISRGDSLKAFVASGVPNLKLYLLFVDLHLADFKVDTDCWHKVISESVLLGKVIKVSSIGRN